MRERPIIFSASMVRALLDERKTQTRRVLRDGWLAAFASEEARDASVAWSNHGHSGPGFYAHCTEYPDEGSRFLRCPYGAPGDRLWVRETWQVDAPRDGSWCDTVFYGDRLSPLDWVPKRFRNPAHVLYRAAWTGDELWWRSPIHMPRWASRLTLEVADVRVQRLQEITEEDAREEGVESVCAHCGQTPEQDDETESHWICEDGNDGVPFEHRVGFQRGWDQINGRRAAWASNPWVWVLTFRRLEAA